MTLKPCSFCGGEAGTINAKGFMVKIIKHKGGDIN